MKKGLSTNLHCTEEVSCLVDSGIQFVGRYYSATTQQSEKRITLAEALALSKAGIEIIVFYQDRMDRISDFSASKGKEKAENALRYAASLGQPHGSTIYFSADFDPEPGEVTGEITDFFQSINAVFIAHGNPYKIGVYSSGLACRKLKEAGLVTHTVLSQSTGFNESKKYAENNEWNVLQTIAHAPLCGLGKDDYEPCQVRDGVDFGSFKIGATEVKNLDNSVGLVNKVILHASGDIGVEEHPRGSNGGPRVESMLAVTGNEMGDPWCASAIAAWGTEVLGKAWPLPKSASCDVLLHFARKRNVLKSDPMPGDIFLVINRDNPNDATHTGLVSAVTGNKVATIEGNTNDDGSAEGYGVFARNREITDRLKFIRWTELVDGIFPDSAWTVRVGDNPAKLACLVRDGRTYAPLRKYLELMFPANDVNRDLGWADSRPTYGGRPLGFDVIMVGSESYGWVRDLASLQNLTVEVNRNDIHLVR